MAQSSVVDALCDERMLEQLLRALGCDYGHGIRKGTLITCPMPDHEDKTPSCNPIPEVGEFYCHGGCEEIKASDLVIAHGKASDRAEAMRWIESELRIENTYRHNKTGVDSFGEVVSDPSLTVAQYACLSGISDEIVARFGLEDVASHHKHADDPGQRNGKAKLIGYEKGFYSSVFFPYGMIGGELIQPRVRSNRPDRKTWPAQTIRHKTDNGGVIKKKYHELKIGPYGIQQYEQSPTNPNEMLIVEGESDVHCLHAMGYKSCLGFPGAATSRRAAPSVIAFLLGLNGGDTNLSNFSIIIGSEPGKAGRSFPGKVSRAIDDAIQEVGGIPPKYSILDWQQVVRGEAGTSIGDAKDLWLERGESALRLLRDAINEALGRSCSVEQYASALSIDASISGVTSSVGGDDPWSVFLQADDAPDISWIGEEITGLKSVFRRSDVGWVVEKKDSEGNLLFHQICRPFVITGLDRCDGEILIRASVLQGGVWAETRFEQRKVADSTRICGELGALGLVSLGSRKTDVADCAGAMITRLMEAGSIRDVPRGTGWMGKSAAALSVFGGIDVEPMEPLAANMFQANQERRRVCVDTAAAAREWWIRGVEPFIRSFDGGMRPAHAAPVLALGTAASAPLLLPLATRNVDISPVTWLAGLGGGGKTTLQVLCASIFAPRFPDIDGQASFFANADMSRAALSARGGMARDLPLILDDVMNVPGASNTESKQGSVAARVEAAAALGMMLFNRKPVERGTKDGGLRLTRPFRSTAIFSAEVAMNDELVAAKISAGQNRRVVVVDAKPLNDRGIHVSHSEVVLGLSSSIGGAPADLLIPRVRKLAKSREIGVLFDECRERLEKPLKSLDPTQRVSASVVLMGFALLADVCGVLCWSDALDMAADLIVLYAIGQGLTSDSLSGVDRTLRAVSEMRAANPKRFEAPNEDVEADLAQEHRELYSPSSHLTIWGRDVVSRKDGRSMVALTRPGRDALMRDYGITAQMIGECVECGACEEGRKISLWGKRSVRATAFFLPDEEPDPSDEDPELVHDSDPHNLKTVVLSDDVSTITTNRSVEELLMDRETYYYQDGMHHVSRELAAMGEALHARVRLDAVDEFRGLQKASAAHGVVVPDWPESDHPGWLTVDSWGEHCASSLWDTAKGLSLRGSDPGLVGVDRDNAREALAKAYRVLLMTKFRHPEWFIVVEGDK